MKAVIFLTLFSSAVMAEQQTANTTTNDLNVLIQKAGNLRNTLPMSDATLIGDGDYQALPVQPPEPVQDKSSE